MTNSQSIIVRATIVCIRLYQRTLSPDTGFFASRHPYGFCRFFPTCSSYAIDALRSHGFLRGSAAAISRILRCHPWHEGGYDPVR